MMVGDRKSFGGIVIDQPAGNGDGFVGRVVEHLDVEFLQRIVQAANGFEQPLDHELLVEDRELDCDPGSSGKWPGGSVVRFFLCL